MPKLEKTKLEISKKIIMLPFNFPSSKKSGMTLTDILQTEVSQEYFLSQKTMQGLMKGQSKPEVLEL